VKLRRFLGPLLVSLALLLALLFGVAWIPVRQARTAWLNGRNAEAISIAVQWSRLGLWRRQYHQIFALSYLSAGNETGARPHLAAIGDVWFSAVDKGSVARRLFDTGKEGAFLEYDAASHDRYESADASLYRAAAQAGVNVVLVDVKREFADGAEAMLAAAAKADDIAFMRLDQRFNILIATAARNEFARRSMGLMNALSRRFWYQHYQQVADLPLAAKLHAAVAEAVSQRKVQAAASASDRLIDYIEDFARKTLDT